MDLFDLYDKVVFLLGDPRQTVWIAPLLWLGDAVLTTGVVRYTNYTEIDFSTYMQQVELFLKGVRDYTLIEGDTGPCVYPAGHLYTYTAVYYLTDHGENILKGQIVFAGLYLVTLAVVMTVYWKCKAPPYLFPFLVLSYRLHSIFVLRLFNDCFAVLFLFLAILAFQNRHWQAGSIALSLGISVKMSILLAMPGVVLVLGQAMPVFEATGNLALIGVIQVGLAVPFLSSNAGGYLARAFDFSRQFLFKWTVNWRFVGEETFLSKHFAQSLLLFHAILLAFFTLTRWTRPANMTPASLLQRVFKPLPPRMEQQINRRISPVFTATTVLCSMAIGMLAARSLHYQFYANIFWATPLLLWRAQMHPVLIFVIWALQEWSWNQYPSTNASSMVVVAMLAVQVLSVWWGTRNKFKLGEVQDAKRKEVHSR